MDALQQIILPIKDDMQQYGCLFQSTLTSDNPILSVALKHLAQRKGKMMRPILVLLATRYVGTPLPGALHAAVALELLHTASLVHDDVVDESDQRRGQRSVNALLGNKEAVLVGDFLLSKSMMHGTQSGDLRVMEHIAWLGQQLADGELLQLDVTHHETFSEERYFEVIDKKTASLFQISATLGAVLAQPNGESSVEAQQQMTRFGQLVGRVFQLRDDIFDYDQHNLAGKPTGNDLREGKLTLPLLYALQHAGTDADREIALCVRRGEATEAEIAHMVQLAIDGGGIDYARTLMHQMTDEAIALLDKKAPADVTDALKTYARFVAGREV